MNKKVLDIIGLASLAISLIADFVSDWADNKSVEALIDEKLDERGIKKLDPPEK